MKKKIISALLTLGIAAAVLPGLKTASAAAEERNYIYHPGKNPYYPIMNIEMAEDSKFLRDFGPASFNMADVVGLDADMGMKANYEISIHEPFANISDENSFTDYADHVRFGATFRGDKHKDAWTHCFTALKTAQRMVIGARVIDGPFEDSTATKFYSDGEFVGIDLNNRYQRDIKVGRSAYCECPCGSPKFGNPVINYADLTAPTVTGWYATFSDDMELTAPADPVGRKESGKIYSVRADFIDDDPKKWDDLYIHIQFSEAIRFSDDTHAHSDDVYLGFDMTSIETKQSTGKTFYAKMYALRENVLSFKMDTAEFMDENSVNYLNGQYPEHYISDFTDIIVTEDINSVGATTKSALYANDGYDLEYILYGEPVVGVDKNSALKTHILNNFPKVDSLFTDLVGNACAVTPDDLGNLVTPYVRATMDARHPYVEDLRMDVYDQYWQLYSKPVKNGDEVNEYLKEGFHIRFFVDMSEDTSLSENPGAVTNLTYADGKPVTIECTRALVDDPGVYSYDSDIIYQYDLTVTADMIPPPLDEEGNAVPITITELTGSVMDMNSNFLYPNPDTGSLLPAADKQLKLDTLPPSVTVEHDKNDAGQYEPVVVDSENRIIRIDFTLADDTTHGPSHASGLVGNGADVLESRLTLYQANSHPNSGVGYEYAILPYDTAPYENDYVSGVTKISNKFAHITSDGVTAPYSLYLKLPDNFPLTGLPLTCKIVTQDYVGHSVETQFEISAEDLTNLLDHTSPEVTIKDSAVTFDSTENTGGFKISFDVYDATGVDADTLKYAFLDAEREPEENEWIYAKQVDGSLVDGNTISIVNAVHPETFAMEEKDIYFYIYADDTTENPNENIYGPYVYNYNKQYQPHTVDVDEKIAVTKPKIRLTYTGTVQQFGLNQIPQNIWVWVAYRPKNPTEFFGENGLFSDPDHYILTQIWLKTDGQPVDVARLSLLSTGSNTGGPTDPRRAYYGKFDTETLEFELDDEGIDYDTLAEIFDSSYETTHSNYYSKFYGKMEARYYMADVLNMRMNEDGRTGKLGFPEGTNAAGESYEAPIYRSPVYELWFAGNMNAAGRNVTEIDASFEDIDLVSADTWTPDSDGQAALSSLAGEVLNVNINPSLTAYGLDLLDKEKSTVSVIDDTGHVLYTDNIKEANMRIVLPRDAVEGETVTDGKVNGEKVLTYSDGTHEISVEVHVELKEADGRTVENKTITYDPGIFVDHTELTDFGVGAVVTHTENNTGRSEPDAIADLCTPQWYGYAYDNPDENFYHQTIVNPEVTAPYTRPTRLVLNSYVPAEAGVTCTHSVVFTENNYSGSDDNEYLQVSNTTDGVTHEGVWKNSFSVISTEQGNSTYEVVVYESADALNDADHGENELPLIANQDNIISYRKVRSNGLKSPVYTMILHPDTTTDETTVEIRPDGDGTLVRSVTGHVTSAPVGAQIYRFNHQTNQWEVLPENVFALVPYRNNSGSYADEIFYAIDMEGNITFTKASVPSNYWSNTPTLSVEEDETAVPTSSGNVVAFDLTASYGDVSDYLTKYGAKLHVGFTQAYAARVGLDSVTYELPPQDTWDDPNVYRFEPDESNRHAGIFSFALTAESDGLRIEDLYILHRYNEDAAENSEEFLTLTFTLEDAAGNLSAPVEQLIAFKNIEPKINHIAPEQDVAYAPVGGTDHTFSVPTIRATVPIAEVYPSTLSPYEAEEYRTQPSKYKYWLKPFVDSYNANDLEVTIVDMFGNVHTATAEALGCVYTSPSDIQYSMSMDIQFSEPVNGKVTMSYQSMDPNTFVDIAQVSGTLPADLTPGESSGTHTILAARVNKAVIEIDEDKPIVIFFYDPEHPDVYIAAGFDPVVIPECVNRPVTADIQWYFEEFRISMTSSEIAELKANDKYDLPATTSGRVYASLVTDKHVEEQTGTSHTFVYGGDTEFTFEYVSLSGVEGSITARLSDIPITLTEPAPVTTDTDAPEYAMDIYGKYGSSYKNMLTYSSYDNNLNKLEDSFEEIDYVQGYLLDFDITDDSPVKLVVKTLDADLTTTTYDNAVSDTIDGVTVKGNQVWVDKAADFMILFIDAQNNGSVLTLASFNFKVDTTPPFIDKKVEIANGLYGKIVYLALSDNATPSEITWISPAGTERIADGGTYDGYYALVFDNNGTKNVTFRDKAGNIASENITVDGIDKTKAAVTSVRWLPSNGNDTTLAPTLLTNKSVVAFVRFNTHIQTLTVTDAKNPSIGSAVEVLLQDDQAVITFNDSNRIENALLPWDLTLNFTAVNGATNTYPITLEPIIDKEAPTFTLYYDETTPAAYVDVTIKNLSEDAYLSRSGNHRKTAGEDITERITENGHYTYVFTDEAGNQTRQGIDITCIDNTPPVIIVDMPNTTAPTKENITIRATMDEKGEMIITDNHEIVKTVTNEDGTFKEVVIDGMLTPVSAPTKAADGTSEFHWIEYTVEENGGYRVVAVDEVGRITETYFSVSNIDRTAPSVSFSPATITVIQGTPVTDVLQILDTGASAWDNRSPSEKVTLTLDSSVITEERMSRTGVFPVTYTAKDEAGNEAKATRFVKVFPENEIQVTLNGEKTFRSEIVLLKSEQIALGVSNLPGGDGEPYSVYLRQGRWKEGQMKTRSEKLDVTTALNGAEYYTFTAEKNKYYTVYLVTQSRGTYITHFYVQ